MCISRLIVSVFILGFVLLVSCSKDETSPTQTDTHTQIMTATVDGNAWDGSTSATVRKAGTVTTIIGRAENGHKITFSLNDPIMAHFTYLNSSTIRIEGSTTVWSSNPGGTSIITIDTSSSTIIGGKFSFIGVPLNGASGENKVVTEGKFSLKF